MLISESSPTNLELLDFRFELGDRLFKFQEFQVHMKARYAGGGGRFLAAYPCPAPEPYMISRPGV